MNQCFNANSIIDLIGIAAVFPGVHTRGFANSITVRSRCWDACIVVDGGLSFLFNDGAIVRLDIHPEDALKTVLMSV